MEELSDEMSATYLAGEGACRRAHQIPGDWPRWKRMGPTFTNEL